MRTEPSNAFEKDSQSAKPAKIYQHSVEDGIPPTMLRSRKRPPIIRMCHEKRPCYGDERSMRPIARKHATATASTAAGQSRRQR